MNPLKTVIAAEGAFDMIGYLPGDLRLVIFSFLGHKGVALCARICKEWLQATKNQFLWYNLFKNNWQLLYSTNEDWNEGTKFFQGKEILSRLESSLQKEMGPRKQLESYQEHKEKGSSWVSQLPYLR